MRNTMRNWMLGTALMGTVAAAGALSANAQNRDFHRWTGGPASRYRVSERPAERGYDRSGFRVGVAVGGPIVENGYIPPCPGDGYVWTAGYYDGGAWMPGSWVYRGGYGVTRYSRDRYIDRDRNFGRDRDFDRHDRDFNRGNARGSDRGAGRGFDRR